MTDVVIPADLWDEDQEGVLVSWMYGDGADVEEGEILVEIMVEKTQYEITAPASGTLHHKVDEDALVTRGQTIATID